MELELLKFLNSVTLKDKEILQEFYTKFKINMILVDEFVLNYDTCDKTFGIGIVGSNGYDGYDIYHRDLKDFDFLKKYMFK